MDKQKPMTLGTLLERVKGFSKEQNNELNSLCVYTTLEVCRKLDLCLSDWCYLEDSPTSDDKGEDVFSLFVRENDLEVLCYGVNIVDVVSIALRQKSAVTTLELLESLTYYFSRDAFLNLNKKNFSEINFVIIPNLTKEQFTPIVERFGVNRLREYKMITLKQALVIYTYDKKSSYAPLADYVSRINSYALVISINNQYWSHMLYLNGYCSPSDCLLPGQERKKKPKMELGANMEAFKKVFPDADVAIMEHYLYQTRFRGPERSAQTIKEFYISRGISEKLIQRNGGFYVMSDDRFPVGNSHQAFDFMRYLGFDFPMDLF